MEAIHVQWDIVNWYDKPLATMGSIDLLWMNFTDYLWIPQGQINCGLINILEDH